MRPFLKGLVAALVASALVAALAFGLTRDPRRLPGVAVGKPAPAFELRDLAGERLGLADLRGRPAVINFWASWCTECEKEHPYLMQAHDRWGDKVAFLGIVFNDSRENIRRFLVERGEDPKRSYPNLIDPGTRTAIDYGVYGVPETFFVDRRGVVTFKRVGGVSPGLLEQQLRRITR